MRPGGRSPADERLNDTEQTLVPLAPQSGLVTCRLQEDDVAVEDDKITICETILLSLQHVMVAGARCVLAVLYISPSLCLLTDDPIRGLLLARFLAVSGITTLFQTFLGVRLPLAYAPCLPTLVAMSLALSWMKCPSTSELIRMEDEERARFIAPRLGEIQGALLVTSLVGATIAVSTRWLSRSNRPALAAAASIAGALVALKPVADVASTSWPMALGVAATAAALAMITIRKVRLPLPLPACSASRGFHLHSHPVGAVSAVLTVMFAWFICAVLTAAGVISDESALSTSPHRLDRMTAPSGFLVPSSCWSWPSWSSEGAWMFTVATTSGFCLGMLLNWGSWTAVLAATHPQSVGCGGCPDSWKGFLGYALSMMLAVILGAPAPASGGADTAGVAFFARTAGKRAAGLTPPRVCGILLILLSLFPSASVAVCSVPLAPLSGMSLLLIASSGGAGLLYLENVNLRAFRLRLLLGLVLLATLTQSFYTFCGQSS